MVYKQTKLKIVDNSGAKIIKIFHLLKYSLSQKYSKSGDLVLGSIFRYKAHKKISKKQLWKVLIITSNKNVFRKNGNFIKFDENRGVVLESKKLLGTRIFGPVSREVQRSTYNRVLSITKEIL